MRDQFQATISGNERRRRRVSYILVCSEVFTVITTTYTSQRSRFWLRPQSPCHFLCDKFERWLISINMTKAIALLAVLTTVACSKDAEKPPRAKVAEPPPASTATVVPPTPTPSAAAPVAKSEYTPAELFTQVASMTSLEARQLFVDGVSLTLTIKSVADDPAGEFVVAADASEGRTMEFTFADFGKAAKAAKLTAGAALKLKGCSITNPQGKSMRVVMCQLAQ